jgi:GT2 family glycosyltransferase
MNEITLSVVSHGHGPVLALLLSDLDRLASPHVARVVVTLNVDEPWQPPPRVGRTTVEVVRNRQPLGFAENHNRAFARCDTPVFAVVNPDIRMAEDPWPALVRALRDDTCGLAVPWQVNAQGDTEDFRRLVPTPWGLLRRTVMRRKVLTDTDRLEWAAGSFMVFRKPVFEALGGFDAGYRLYCEDVDLCLRLQLNGWRIEVVPSSRVVHDARRASGSGGRFLRWHLASFLRLWTSAAFWRYRKLR